MAGGAGGTGGKPAIGGAARGPSWCARATGSMLKGSSKLAVLAFPPPHEAMRVHAALASSILAGVVMSASVAFHRV
jgi:hypothetical protein